MREQEQHSVADRGQEFEELLRRVRLGGRRLIHGGLRYAFTSRFVFSGRSNMQGGKRQCNADYNSR